MKYNDPFIPLLKKTRWEIDSFNQDVIAAKKDVSQMESIVNGLQKSIKNHNIQIRKILEDSKCGLNIDQYNLLKINVVENTRNFKKADELLNQKIDIYTEKVHELNRMNDRLNKLEEKSDLRKKEFMTESDKNLLKEMDELWLMRIKGSGHGY